MAVVNQALDTLSPHSMRAEVSVRQAQGDLIMLQQMQTLVTTDVPVFPSQLETQSETFSVTSQLSDALLPLFTQTPEESRVQGQNAGRAEATELLAQATAIKGGPLTTSEVMECYGVRFKDHMKQNPFNEATRHFSEGWYQGFIEVCIQARSAAPEPVPFIKPKPVEVEPEPVAGAVNFRQAQIETDDVDELARGIECGRACFVEDGLPLTTQSLFTLFAGAIDADDPEAYNIGFIIGHVDALCQNLKTAPAGFLCGASSTKKRTKRAKRKQA